MCFLALVVFGFECRFIDFFCCCGPVVAASFCAACCRDVSQFIRIVSVLFLYAVGSRRALVMSLCGCIGVDTFSWWPATLGRVERWWRVWLCDRLRRVCAAESRSQQASGASYPLPLNIYLTLYWLPRDTSSCSYTTTLGNVFFDEEHHFV